MKALKHKLAVTLAFLPLCAFAGPGTDGGNVFRSSEADVRAAVNQLKLNPLFGLVSEAQTRQLLNAKYVQDADLKKVLLSMQAAGNNKGSGVELVNEASSAKLEPKPLCRDENGKEVDASTTRERNAPVCFNVRRLRRFPRDQLKLELANLALHELAHHFGHDDKLAYKFQTHMREFVKNFFEMGSLSTYFPGVKYLELRPGGTVDVETKGGKSQVTCLKGHENNVEIQQKLATGDVSLILGGAFMVKSSVNGPVAVSCRKYPTIDCADYLYAKSADEIPQLVRAGICKKAGSSAAPAEAEPAENTSAE